MLGGFQLEDLPLGDTWPAVWPDAWSEPVAKHVRVEVGGSDLASSGNARLLLERGRMPVYYFPDDDVDWHGLVESTVSHPSPTRGPATFWDHTDGERRAVAWSHAGPAADALGIAGHTAFYWAKCDRWFEEGEEVFVHARDPYRRVEILETERRVTIEIAGTPVAASTRALRVIETGLPIRHYLPADDVHPGILAVTDTTTRCPYKGVTRYFDATVGDQTERDIAWSYPEPIAEAQRLGGRVAFHDERVTTYLDGVEQPRPERPTRRSRARARR